MKIDWKVDDDRVLRRLDRLGLGPDAEAILQFETALVVRMIKTQAVVHVDTGDLKRSGKTTSRSTGFSWEGTIQYGDLVPGGVEYAHYEQRREGRHDFMAPIQGEMDDKDYIDIMVDWMRRNG